MAEYISPAIQTVAAGQNVLFTSSPVKGGNGILHRDGSGIVTLRGCTNQCRALYQVNYSGNIAVATGGTAGAISLAIAIDGEPLSSATGIVTPAAVGDYFSVAMSAQISAPKGCCVTVSVENTTAQAIDVQNSNLTIARIA